MSITAGLYNRETMEGCEQERAICIDLARDMRNAFEDSDFYDFVHTTPSGAAKIGGYLYGQLKDVVR